MQYIAEPYQGHATAHIQKYRGTGLFMEMGLGKTVATLTAIIEMLEKRMIKKTLVIAPLAVARDTWSDEIDKWDHTRHLRVSKILGTQKEREAALKVDADIYLINCENVPWLIALMQGRWPWDFLVVDEISKFKSAKSRRFKALRMILPKVKRVTGLTGTPRPNGLLDLWSQLFILDNGERLGKTLGQYREQYFKVDKQVGHVVYSYKLKKGEDPLLGDEIYATAIYDKIADICISMRAKDYITLPPRIDRIKWVSMDSKLHDQYDQFEEDLIMEIAEKEITAANAAVLSGKLLQFSNGAIYDDNKLQRTWHHIHDEKLNALEDIIDEAQGAPVLVFYNYKHDLERITKKFKHLKPRLLKGTEALRDWNDGKIQLALAHQLSAGHGLNLQAGGCIIVWFGLSWSLEGYAQANARLHRKGQLKPVIIHHILTKDTLDKDVLDALHNKHNGQKALMKSIRARIDYYKNAV